MFARNLVLFLVSFCLFNAISSQCPKRCHCSKYKVFCTEARLRSLPRRVYETTELLRIELDKIPRIETTSGLQKVTHLKLVKIQLQNIQPRAFCNMTSLEFLEITFNNITTLRGNTFTCLDNLYFLNLSHNRINNFEPRAFAGLQVRMLDLSYNEATFLNRSVFEGMKHVNNCNLEAFPCKSEYFLGNHRIGVEVLEYMCKFSLFRTGGVDRSVIPSHITSGLHVDYFGVMYVNVIRAHSRLLYLNTFIHRSVDYKFLCIHGSTLIAYIHLHYNATITGKDVSERWISLKNLKIDGFSGLIIERKAFLALKSLENLDLSSNILRKIERDVYFGLSKLRILDLSDNEIERLENNTFSTLRMLRELKLEYNKIRHIDIAAFSHLTLLKYLSIDSLLFQESSLKVLERLDSLILSGRVSLPQDLQVLKLLSVELRSENPQQNLRDDVQKVRYMKTVKVDFSVSEFIRQDLNLFLENSRKRQAEFHDTRLSTSCKEFIFFKKSTIIFEYATLIAIYESENSRVNNNALLQMKYVKELQLNLYNEFALKFINGSFHGFNNLKSLRIIFFYPSRPFDTCLDAGIFQSLRNLTTLTIQTLTLTCINPGTFQGLSQIEEINLEENNINKIEAGVFGALCEDEFELSCKNVTLPEYCNSTDALTTLKYLDLSRNNISHIHPHAFISCINLNTLDLSLNPFLNLDYTFLFTPGLKVLNMSFCDVEKIPINTFECTPLLSQINLYRNRKLNKLIIHTLLPMRHLQSIDLFFCYISCDCDLYQTWTWLRQHHVHYTIDSSCPWDKYSSTEAVDKAMTNIECNITKNEASESKNHTAIKDDFTIFKEYIEPIVLIIIFTSGFVCNGFLLFVSFWHSDMRTQHNACVIHLATVDVLSLVLNLPLSYWDVLNVTWEFDDTLCKVFLFSKDVMVGVTVLSVVALSVERFLVARNFKELKKMCSKSEKPPIVWLLMMAWISAIVTSLPAYFSAKADYRCLYCPPGNKDYIRNVWTFQLVMYCLAPAIVIMFLNIKTSQFLRESISKIPGELKHNVKARNRKTSANTVLVLVLLFGISNFPSYILRVLVAWSVVDMEDLFLVSFFTFCLFFFNTVFNPISLFIMSSKYKSYALRYITFLGNEQDY